MTTLKDAQKPGSWEQSVTEQAKDAKSGASQVKAILKNLAFKRGKRSEIRQEGKHYAQGGT